MLTNEQLKKYVNLFNDDNMCFFEYKKGYLHYHEMVDMFINDFYNSNMMDTEYEKHLEEFLNEETLLSELIKTSDISLIKSVLTYYIRGERFCEGMIAKGIENNIFRIAINKLEEYNNKSMDMVDKSLIIKQASELLLNNDKENAIKIINSKYKFECKEIKSRSYTDNQKMRIFIRDGFIDRYSGERLINPGILKVFSTYYPKEFPYHTNWKMSETHIAYWDLYPTIDHINPIAIGGDNNEENLITTSMLHNLAKSNFTIEKLGWEIYNPGDIKIWDGLTDNFIKIVENDKALLEDNYIKRWYRASINNV